MKSTKQQNPKPQSQKKKTKQKPKRVLKSAEVQKYLSALNPYVMTVADPFAVRGVKIPDAITTPSSTFSLTLRGSVTAGPSDVSSMITVGWSPLTNDAAMRHVGLIPLPLSTVASLSYKLGSAINSTTSSFSPAASTAVTMLEFPQWSVADPTIKNLYSMARLVSAGVAINYTGAPLNASGAITAVGVPVATLRNTFNTTFSISQLQNLPGASISPINDFKGGLARYIPIDCSKTVYVQLDTDSNSSVLADAVDIELHTPGAMGIALTGMPVGAWSYQYTIVANYEGIPRSNSASFVTTEVSRSDPIALSHASNVLETLPTALPTAAPATVSPPAGGPQSGTPDGGLAMHEEITARTESHAKELAKTEDGPLGFMGSVMEAVENIGGVVSKVAPLALALL